ncbi:MAG: 16S rRNA (uracil(1498)-N(3))-methyltransferase [Candidatus Edwardsbacteria bacterium]
MLEFFYTPPEKIFGQRLLISGDEARHITKVMRHKLGDRILVVDGLGSEYEAVISVLSETSLEAKILHRRRKTNEPIVKVSLAQGLVKGARFDILVEKATEIGVWEIIPLLTSRTEVIPNEENHRSERWQRIAIAAMKQSQRSVLPKIEPPTLLGEVVKKIKEYDLAILAFEGEKKLRLPALFTKPKKEIRRILCLIGPEGGFTKQEMELAGEKGVMLVGLGPRRLRSETAGIVLLTLIMFQMQEV